MRSALLAAALVRAALAVAAVAGGPRVGADAAWAPPQGFLAEFHAACDSHAGPEFGKCFLAAMGRAGASPAALAFAAATGDQGYLIRFRECGVVDVAIAEYPFRANENFVWFLVNGRPPMIDVDGAGAVDPKALAANPDFARIAKQHPNVTVFPGDRGAAGPRPEAGKEGGQRFLVDYSLHDGCHACAVLGALTVSFAFDAGGKLVGTRIVRVAERAGS